MRLILIRNASGWLPAAMSLAALAIVLGHWAKYGIVHEADEGAAAHLFQILMAAQIPIIGYFALKWLPRAPGQALAVLGVQLAMAIAAFASVYFLT